MSHIYSYPPGRWRITSLENGAVHEISTAGVSFGALVGAATLPNAESADDLKEIQDAIESIIGSGPNTLASRVNSLEVPDSDATEEGSAAVSASSIRADISTMNNGDTIFNLKSLIDANAASITSMNNVSLEGSLKYSIEENAGNIEQMKDVDHPGSLRRLIEDHAVAINTMNGGNSSGDVYDLKQLADDNAENITSMNNVNVDGSLRHSIDALDTRVTTIEDTSDVSLFAKESINGLFKFDRSHPGFQQVSRGVYHQTDPGCTMFRSDGMWSPTLDINCDEFQFSEISPTMLNGQPTDSGGNPLRWAVVMLDGMTRYAAPVGMKVYALLPNGSFMSRERVAGIKKHDVDGVDEYIIAKLPSHKIMVSVPFFASAEKITITLCEFAFPAYTPGRQISGYYELMLFDHDPAVVIATSPHNDGDWIATSDDHPGVEGLADSAYTHFVIQDTLSADGWNALTHELYQGTVTHTNRYERSILFPMFNGIVNVASVTISYVQNDDADADIGVSMTWTEYGEEKDYQWDFPTIPSGFIKDTLHFFVYALPGYPVTMNGVPTWPNKTMNGKPRVSVPINEAMTVGFSTVGERPFGFRMSPYLSGGASNNNSIHVV